MGQIKNFWMNISLKKILFGLLKNIIYIFQFFPEHQYMFCTNIGYFCVLVKITLIIPRYPIQCGNRIEKNTLQICTINLRPNSSCEGESYVWRIKLPIDSMFSWQVLLIGCLKVMFCVKYALVQHHHSPKPL